MTVSVGSTFSACTITNMQIIFAAETQRKKEKMIPSYLWHSFLLSLETFFHLLNFHIHLGKMITEKKLFKGSLGSTGVLSFHLSEKSVLGLLTIQMEFHSWFSELVSFCFLVYPLGLVEHILEMLSEKRGQEMKVLKKSDTHETRYAIFMLNRWVQNLGK